MSTINILEPSVFNKISAGEVVEKPASIIKELVENSIDAGATRVEIKIYQGGIDKIVVEDNGKGILPDDMELAFLPHATSKIKDFADLDAIGTLGFRGEALASIASVSIVEVVSKAEGNEGQMLKLSGGKIIEKGQVGAPQGTRFCVQDLFFNTPARRKFLKKPKKEESDITTLVARLILANPNIAIKYYADDRLIYNSTGRGVEDAIFAIYGASTMQNIIPVDYTSGQYHIHGYIGKTTYFKSNRTYQTIMINGRWVADSIVSVAVSQSYESYMMKHCFPFCVLYFDLPIADVDVNVHPSKLEVRFADARSIFGFIYKAVSESLFADITKKTEAEVNADSGIKSQLVSNENAYTPLQVISNNLSDKEIPISNANDANITNDSEQNVIAPTLDINIFDVSNDEGKTLNLSSSQNSVLGEIYVERLVNTTTPKYQFDTTNDTEITPQPVQTQLVADEVQDKQLYLESRVIGKLFNTFVILEMNDCVYFVDQHAAHERLLYDKFNNYLKKQEMTCQPMLIPYMLEVNPTEEQFVLDNIDNLKQLGFDIDLFGTGCFRVSAVPSILPDINPKAFFETFLSNMNTYNQLRSEDLVLDKLAQTACKHAVKGGDDLDKSELIKLVSDFSDGNVTLQCPHGRPFLIKLSRLDFDKWFKRNV